jgi:hypothetical protein
MPTIVSEKTQAVFDRLQRHAGHLAKQLALAAGNGDNDVTFVTGKTAQGNLAVFASIEHQGVEDGTEMNYDLMVHDDHGVSKAMISVFVNGVPMARSYLVYHEPSERWVDGSEPRQWG